ncbi:sulfatase [Paenibacillus hodogayensis]|uniref:Sulfatase n=1 Tax=Paenibacillus hodogayensis TaxID=279208 RepID=A0ABV5VWJ6_9BACL
MQTGVETERQGTLGGERPNVLWILCDQMRAQATSIYGDSNVSTPEIDRLAKEGVRFVGAVSGTPWCTPFRGALLTGQYPHQSGVLGNYYPLPAEAKTIAHQFRDHGYRTCWIGKWHLAGRGTDAAELPPELRRDSRRFVPPERRGGFEHWFAYENNNKPYDCWVHTHESASGEAYRLSGYETDSLTDLAIDWIEKQTRGQDGNEKPFFAALSVQPPHSPYDLPPGAQGARTPDSIRFRPNVPGVDWVREQAARELVGYYAAIERLDWNVGRIRRALERLGIDKKTYIVFFSDHGDMHGSHGQFRKSCPWEEAVRIPFIIGGPPDMSGAASIADDPLNHVDIAPTTLGLCGIPKPNWMVGSDYSGNATGVKPATPPPDSAYLSLVVPSGVRDGLDRPFRGIVTRDGWKYVALERQPWLLFRLTDDPYEQVNLAHVRRYHPFREPLHRRLAQWIEETGDRFALE